jgi:predicted nucleic acid-binding protein
MGKWVCLDASLILSFTLSTTRESPLYSLWQTWHQSGCALAAPTLLYYEVSNALHHYVMHRDLSAEQAAQAMQIALDVNVSLHGDADLHRQAIGIARRLALPAAYYAHYLALAERLGAELWTADRRLHQAVGASMPWVHLL